MPTSAPSQAQIAGLSGLSGLFSGISKAGDAEAAQKAAYLKMLNDPRLPMQREGLDIRREELDVRRQNSSGSGGGGQPMLFGQIYGLPEDDPRYKILVPGKQVASIAAQSFTSAKPSAGEQKATSDSEQMFQLAVELGKQWKEFGFNAPSAGQAVGGKFAQYAPGQISQRLAPEKYTQFDNTKKILSETALRIATGAATNPSEVAVYKSMLPEPGDSPQIAANKINNFLSRAEVKAEDTARRLETQGRKRDADAHRKMTGERLVKLKQQLVMDFGGAPAAPPSAAPSAGGSDLAAKARRAAELKAKKGQVK